MGRSELIASHLDGYVDLAVELAGDLDRLTELRAGLRNQLAASPICDGPAFADNFLIAIRDLWRRRCKPGSAAVLDTQM